MFPSSIFFLNTPFFDLLPKYSLLDQGMAHLEALELLSAGCESDLRNSLVSGGSSPKIHSQLAAIKDLFPAEEDDDDDEEEEDNDNQDPRTITLTEHKERLLREIVIKHIKRFPLVSEVDAASTLAAVAAAEHFMEALKNAWTNIEELRNRVENDAGEKKKNIEGDEDGATNPGVQKDEKETPIMSDSSDPSSSSEEASPTPASIHRACIQSLGSLVAVSIQLVHKIAQMTLVPPFKSGHPRENSIDTFLERSRHLLMLSTLTAGNTNTVATTYGQVSCGPVTGVVNNPSRGGGIGSGAQI